MRKDHHGLNLIGTLLVCFLAGGLFAQADPPSQPPRIALITGSDSADLSSLIVTELSQKGDVTLLERDALEKVGDEHKLREMVDANAVALGRLLGAEGLLFLNKTPDGIQARFTAVGLGYALFDDRFVAKADLPQLAKAIAHRVVDYAPKLKLPPDQAIPISILNLRSDVSEGNGNSLERRLTLLLESRLSSFPEYVILERRHAWALNFENALSSSPPPLLQGARVIDGTLTLPTAGKDEILARLRLRFQGGAPSPMEIRGSTKDLPALAEAMAAAIRKAADPTAAGAPWQSQKEAREYLLEGIWGNQHEAIDAALEALDASALLGETAPDLVATRIPVLCASAVGTSVTFAARETPDDPHPEARIEAALRAIDDMKRYEREQLESKLQILDRAHSMGGGAMNLRLTVDRAAFSLTAMLDRTHHPQADELRSALRSFAGYPPSNQQTPGEATNAIEYADTWAASLEEEISFYRSFFNATAGKPLWAWLSEKPTPDSFGARFIPDLNERHAAFFSFLRSLTDTPSTRLAGLLGLAQWSAPTRQEAACRICYDALWEDRENLVATNQVFQYLSKAFAIEKDRKVSEADPQIIALLHLALQRANRSDGLVAMAWHPELFPEKEAPSLWKDVQDLQARAPGYPGFALQIRQGYIPRFGEPQTGETQAVLPVTRFWCPGDAMGKLSLATHPLLVVPDGVWVAGSYEDPELRAALYHVSIDASRPNPFATAPVIQPPIYVQDLAATTDAVYVLGESVDQWSKSMVGRLDPTSRQWTLHDVPNAHQIFQAGNRLYLSLSGTPRTGEFEGGIALYDDKSGETTVLASSRRRPAQNQFDDREGYNVRSIFSGPGNKPCATVGFGESFYIQKEPGPWPRFIQSGMLDFSQTDGVRTLLYGAQFLQDGREHVAFMVDPTKDEPELWMGTPAPLAGIGMVASKAASTPVPPWPQPPLWSKSDGEDPDYTLYGFRGDDLFAFASRKAASQKELVWYRRGQPKPFHIPLGFKMDENTVSVLKEALAHDPATFKSVRQSGGERLGMCLTPTGICFIAQSQGFWYLPFTDVDAYIKAHPVGIAN